MPTKEIKELRQEGRLEEALNLATNEFNQAINQAIAKNGNSEPLLGSESPVNGPAILWAKRNLAWVYFDYLKVNFEPENFDEFLFWMDKIKNLSLLADEKMLYDNIAWKVGSMVFKCFNSNYAHYGKLIQLRDIVMSFEYSRPSQGYSFLYKAFHRAFKNTDAYLAFAEWWDFNNFMPEDFQKETMPNGKEVMAIAEQAYITYAKQLLPKRTFSESLVFDKAKAIAFMPILSKIIDTYPQFQYPAYFYAKLLLALDDKAQMLVTLLPFAKKKRNDFWVWEILAEAMSDNADTVFACYCKALSCKSPEEMLVSLRQRMAALLISKGMYNEAKTEIELLVNVKNANHYSIPDEIIKWQATEWYKSAAKSKSNFSLYKSYIPEAEALLFSDVQEEIVIVEFINSDKRILNFIASETKFGFFKYDRFFTEIKVGETIKVRFQGGSNEGMHQIYTAVKVNDEAFKKQYMKEVSGIVKIPVGKSFGFIDDVFVHPSLVAKLNLTDGIELTGKSIKTYNKEKKQWSWKLIL
jgi:hypothetical protein